MSKFMFLYRGPANDMSEMTQEQGAAVVQKWGVWIEKTGSALVDVGSPLANGSCVCDDGSDGSCTELSGYSIVEAADMTGARALTEGHPFLSDDDGKFFIEIHELMPMPM